MQCRYSSIRIWSGVNWDEWSALPSATLSVRESPGNQSSRRLVWPQRLVECLGGQKYYYASCTEVTVLTELPDLPYEQKTAVQMRM